MPVTRLLTGVVVVVLLSGGVLPGLGHPQEGSINDH